MTERKVKAVKARKVREGDFIPGLDNGYVFTDPEPSERSWAIRIQFHDQNGEEGSIECDPDMLITVDRPKRGKP